MKQLILISAAVVILQGCALGQQKAGIPEGFKRITYKEFSEEAIKLIGDDWMLVAAGNMEKFNMMTANWGGLGWLWNKPVAFIFVRPQRYTYQFTEKENYFTLTFYEEKHRDILRVMGSRSGRDMDKMKDSGLTPFETENKSVAFAEARIILECKKLYATTLKGEDFIETGLDAQVYPSKDYHKMYVGEIVGIWIK